MYFLNIMKRKKPGPPKGQKINDVERTPVGERLFKSRKARGLTQEQLGLKVGLSKRMIAHYESSPVTPPVDVLTRLADALHVTASYLLGESVQKKIDSDIKPVYRKHLEILQTLPPRKQKDVLEMVEAWADKNSKPRL
jgi:transcriptional regulator with XRE-family HTH domain